MKKLLAVTAALVALFLYVIPRQCMADRLTIYIENPQTIGITIAPITRYTFGPFTPQAIQIERVSFSSIGLPSAGGMVNAMNIQVRPQFPQVVEPQIVIPTLMGKQVSLQMLKGLDFQNIYIADPDMNPDAKSFAKLSSRDLARFGVSGEVQSQLETQLFPKENEMLAKAEPSISMPAYLYSLDDSTLSEG